MPQSEQQHRASDGLIVIHRTQDSRRVCLSVRLSTSFSVCRPPSLSLPFSISIYLPLSPLPLSFSPVSYIILFYIFPNLYLHSPTPPPSLIIICSIFPNFYLHCPPPPSLSLSLSLSLSRVSSATHTNTNTQAVSCWPMSAQTPRTFTLSRSSLFILYFFLKRYLPLSAG